MRKIKSNKASFGPICDGMHKLASNRAGRSFGVPIVTLTSTNILYYQGKKIPTIRVVMTDERCLITRFSIENQASDKCYFLDRAG